MKFSGIVGFWEDEQEVKPGVWRPKIVEKKYVGDVLRNIRSFQQTQDSQTDEFNVNNRISILADLYARQNWSSIKYVEWNGVKWRVRNVEINYPRITLEIGGFYHGETEVGTS